MLMYKFFNKKNQSWEEVEPEIWQWEAVYRDDTLLKQYDDQGIFHQFEEIDQSKLLAFRMVKADGTKSFDIGFNPAEMKLIHFYRNAVLENGQVRIRLFCFGFEKNIRGESVKTIATILPDDKLVISDDAINLVLEVAKVA